MSLKDDGTKSCCLLPKSTACAAARATDFGSTCPGIELKKCISTHQRTSDPRGKNAVAELNAMFNPLKKEVATA